MADIHSSDSPGRRQGENRSRSPVVLLVEDDMVFAALYRASLTADGRYEVLYASTGEQAIELLSHRSAIQCVVTDINLATIDGFEVLRTSKLLRPHTPVLLITGSTNPSFPGIAIRDGADDMLMKPIDPAELVARVEAVIEKGRALRLAHARTVLAVGAHPDDVEIAIGGTLLRHTAAGDRVIHLLLTDGEAGGNRETRIAEAEAAAEMMGATLMRASLRDGSLSEGRDTVALVREAIAEYNPSIIYSHSRNDRHQDHRTTFSATRSAARGVPTFATFQSPSASVQFSPNRFIDIGEYLDDKIKLINVYRSQTATRVYLAEDLIRATAKYWGRFAEHRIVEPLEMVWQVTI